MMRVCVIRVKRQIKDLDSLSHLCLSVCVWPTVLYRNFIGLACFGLRVGKKIYKPQGSFPWNKVFEGDQVNGIVICAENASLPGIAECLSLHFRMRHVLLILYDRNLIFETSLLFLGRHCDSSSDVSAQPLSENTGVHHTDFLPLL